MHIYTESTPWWAKIAGGSALFAGACFCERIDLINNREFGRAIGAEEAMIAAAVGVVAFPAWEVIGGPSRLTRWGRNLSLTLTILAAASAYSAKQGHNAAQHQGAASQYSQAQMDAAEARSQAKAARDEASAARAEAARILENASAVQLAELQQAARDKVADVLATLRKKEIACKDSDACKKAQAAAAEITQRLGLARSKDAALTRARDADGRADRFDAKVDAARTATSGPADVDPIAEALSVFGGQPKTWRARIDALFNALVIALTQVGAMHAGPALAAISAGWAMRPRKAFAVQLEVDKNAGVDVVPVTLPAIEHGLEEVAHSVAPKVAQGGPKRQRKVAQKGGPKSVRGPKKGGPNAPRATEVGVAQGWPNPNANNVITLGPLPGPNVEEQVAQLVAQGVAQRDIAKQVGVSRTQVQRIIKKVAQTSERATTRMDG